MISELSKLKCYGDVVELRRPKISFVWLYQKINH